jgi:hypothetical protein
VCEKKPERGWGQKKKALVESPVLEFERLPVISV